MRAAEVLRPFLALFCTVLIGFVAIVVLQDMTGAATSGVVSSAQHAEGSLTITTPVSYRVFQRDTATDTATIEIKGTYAGTSAPIEASWNGGAYTVIDSVPRGGVYAGQLQDQPVGQGALTVRFVGEPATAVTVDMIGVGDIFVVAGQSNASGYGFSLQHYTPTAGITATLFGNDDTWKELTDPFDSAVGQVDYSSIDTSAYGSFVPLLATHIVMQERIPVAFIPAARSGTSIAQWQPGTPLYESMKRRIAIAGGVVRAVLWFQGESDAKDGTGYAAYSKQMNTMVDQLAADFPGTKVMVGQIGQTRYPTEHLEAIRQAQTDLWSSNANVLPGPVTKDIDLSDEGGDTLHFRSDADLAAFADRWWQQLQTQVYTKSSVVEPILAW